jgi:hypothetical protein
MVRASLVGVTMLVSSTNLSAAQEVLEGTWKLVSSTRTTSSTGTTVDSFGPNLSGYIMYG